MAEVPDHWHGAFCFQIDDREGWHLCGSATTPGVTSITSTAGGWSYRRNMSKHKPIWSLAVVAVLMLPAVASGQEVTGFVLVDASTDLDIGPLTDGDTIDLDVVGDQLNIRAEVTGPVESVRFGLDGTANYQTESTPPYALAGDSGGNYNPWTPGLGGHTLIATPYTEDNAGGVAGTPLEIDFTVTRTPPACPPVTGGTAIISGDLFRWHTVTASFAGPDTSEQAALNPFLDLRLDVTLTHDPSGNSWVVPGFYAADGDAADTGASTGGVWQSRFTPPEEGLWHVAASFRCGTGVAVADGPTPGDPAAFDGAIGSFSIGPSPATGRDFRSMGHLEYTGERYLRFSGTDEPFLKGGADSPENLLGYIDFDDTVDHGGSANDLIDGLHRYQPHIDAGDWQTGDPSWRSGKGKGLIGALNYLASRGMNSVYFLTMNVGGDGREVYPWTGYDERNRFDVSKLDQWEIVFAHMERLGLAMHVITQETENDQLLDGGALGDTRKLYYRELVARFGHHLAVVWNLGEENTNSDAQRKAFSSHIRSLDAFDHPIVVHTYPGQYDAVYTPLLGYPDFEGPSLQMGSMSGTHAETLEWVGRSADEGRPWFVCLDEIGPANTGVKPDADDPNHDTVRHQALWGNLMAGGAGAEWYFGYAYPHNDLDCEDWRSRETMWDQTAAALGFFHDHLPFPAMEPADDLTADGGDYVLALENAVYAVYLPQGEVLDALDLSSATGELEVQWFDPRNGGPLQPGTIATVTAGGIVDCGLPPVDPGLDWVALIRRVGLVDSIFTDDFESGSTGAWSATMP